MITFPKCLGVGAVVPRPAAVVIAIAMFSFSAQVAGASNGPAGDAAALRAAVATERTRPRAPRIDRATFLARPTLRDVALAPNGRHVAWLRDEGRNRSVWMLPAAGGGAKRVLAHTEAERLAWTRDSRWLLLETPRQVFALAVAGQAGSGAIATLGGRAHREFIAADPALPAAILVLERPPIVSRNPRRWKLYRIDMRGRQTLLHEDAKEIVDFAIDPRGHLAFLVRAEGEQHVVHRVDPAGSLQPVIRCTLVERCTLLTTNGGDAVMLTNAKGNFLRVARLGADGTLRSLHDDPRGEADVRDVELDPVTGQPLVVSYESTVSASYGLTPETERHVEAIKRHFPGRNLRIKVARGAGAHWLVRERAGTMRGERVHLYEPRTGALREIETGAAFAQGDRVFQRPPESAMAQKIAFSWRASDGMLLHGFLMVPPGVDPATAPLVTSVHGGPFNHVGPDFSNDGQFLANRGYVVFQPNFRGSTGHGRAYMFAGRSDFGNGRVQQDIVEGVRYLLAQGIGDANRVGITGVSFGGYATLLGVTFQPELFRVGIAAVPPADLGWVLRDYAGSAAEMIPGIPIAISMRHLSLDPADQELVKRLNEQSPIANARQLRRPLLMLAGGEDDRVPIRGVLHYAASLKALGKEVNLFVDAESGHGVEDRRTREAYYYLMETLLHRHLRGATPQPADRELRAHIRRNLLLADRDLKPLQGSGGP
jgi:dienelactone hydrolase